MSVVPTPPTILAAIIADVKYGFNPSTPSNVTTVHDTRRWWNNMATFLKFFRRETPDLQPGKINGAMCYQIGTEEVEAPEWFRFYEINEFEIHMIAGVQDSGGLTFKEFDAQVEAVRNKLRLDRAVFGNTEKTSPVIHKEGPRSNKLDFADFTVWEAFLRLKAEGVEVKFA